jgi:hypothetical protein
VQDYSTYFVHLRRILTQIGYAIALTGLLSYRLTGGSENSPLGQKVVKVFTSVSNVSAPTILVRGALLTRAGAP